MLGGRIFHIFGIILYYNVVIISVCHAYITSITTRYSSSNNVLYAEKEQSIHKVDNPIQRRRQRNLDYWGVEYLDRTPTFPTTFEELSFEICQTITGTINGLQRVDPNIASNAVHKSVLDYRPTHPFTSSKRRWLNGDDSIKQADTQGRNKNISARMGIEIDGATYLLDDKQDEGRAIRLLSLHIAKRLSTQSWGDMAPTEKQQRPVCLYFNSIEQSLLASRELNQWKREEIENKSLLDNIQIYCLVQDPIPPSMGKGKSSGGIVLVIKPTDFVTDSLVQDHLGDDRNVKTQEPRIQANIIDKLQALLFQASAFDIPTVVLSPRLSELPPMQIDTVPKRLGPTGFEQSGYQKASTYGGVEPPIGPTAWLLRDLIPPSYSWVGSAKQIGQRSRRSLRSIAATYLEQQNEDNTSSHAFNEDAVYSYHSRIVMKQSAMETGHLWHMFVVKETISSRRQSEKISTQEDYHYIGSSISSRGRPSSRIMKDLFEEFILNPPT